MIREVGEGTRLPCRQRQLLLSCLPVPIPTGCMMCGPGSLQLAPLVNPAAHHDVALAAVALNVLQPLDVLRDDAALRGREWGALASV